MTEKALIIHGPLGDLSDVLRIARVEAKKILNVERVIIKPVVLPYAQDKYVVFVEPELARVVVKPSL